MTKLSTYHKGERNFGTGYEMINCIEELEDKLDWVIVERDKTFALMLQRVQTAEAKLAKAVEALDWIGRRSMIIEADASSLRLHARMVLAELKSDDEQ